MYLKDLQQLDGALDAARKSLIAQPELLAKAVDATVESLHKLSQDSSIPLTSVSGRLDKIQKELEKALDKLPPNPTNDELDQAWNPIDTIKEGIRSLPKTTDERVKYDWDVAPLIDKKIEQLNQDIGDSQKFRIVQAEKITKALSLLEKNIVKPFYSGVCLDLERYKILAEAQKTVRAFNDKVMELIQ